MKFLLEPGSHGARSLLLADSLGRRVPLGDVAENGVCEVRAEGLAALYIGCAGALRVGAFRKAEDGQLEIWRTMGLGESADQQHIEAPPIDERMPVDLDATLEDPAPPVECGNGYGPDVTLSLEQRPHGGDRDIRMRSTVLPLDWRKQIFADGECVAQRDLVDTLFKVECSHVAGMETYEFRVENGTLLVKERTAGPCLSTTEVMGGWRLPCGSRVRFPQAQLKCPEAE